MIRKTCFFGTALALAISLTPVQAAGLLAPNSPPAADSLVLSVKMKHKGKISKMMHRMAGKMKRHRRHARHGGRRMAMSHGGCKGMYMYRKGGKCMDSRNK